MINFIYQIIRTARPRQWLKNLSIFAAPVFQGNLFDPAVFGVSVRAFIAFCGIASAGYFINDIVDAPKDSKHPVKKNRPIASGRLSKKAAWIIASALIVGTSVYSWTAVGTFFTFLVWTYIVIQLIYSFKLRNVIILDAMVVASLFIVRVFAGGVAASISISAWLVLATIGLSLLLAFGKRRSEKTLLSSHLALEEKAETRQTLRHYPDSLLDSMISMSASFCIITYSLFAFQISPELDSKIFADILPSILQSPKLMMLTIPVVIYGVARYLYVIYEKKEGESPARVLMSDRPLLATVIIWGILVLVFLNLFSL